MTELQFEVIERPKITRDAGPNPYAETVKDLDENGKPEQAVAVTIPMGESFERKRGDGKETKYRGVEANLRLLRQAAPEGKSVRTVVSLNKPVKGSARIAFWVGPKIVRNAKPADGTPAETPAEETPAPAKKTAAKR